MKYIQEFRQQGLAVRLAQTIKSIVKPDQQYRLMEFCGGHTHAIYRHGLKDLMPDNVDFIHGPGCPVCVLPAERIDQAMEMVKQSGAILCIYADLLRVPASNGYSLLEFKASDADVRPVYSALEVLSIARSTPTKDVIFFAIGFETTTPPTAVLIRKADELGLKNLSVFCNHVLTPAALNAILNPEDGQLNIDGFIGPSHVSTVIGSDVYRSFASDHHKPIVISGFEPLDILQAITMLIQQLNVGAFRVENQYKRAVTACGNRKAQTMIAEVFDTASSFRWRGLGKLENSALCINDNFRDFDAEYRFSVNVSNAKEHKQCLCPSVIRGRSKPKDCKLFAKACTPENPLGACMVSSEGACAAYWSYGRLNANASSQRII